MTVFSAPLWRRRGSIRRRTTWILILSGEWQWQYRQLVHTVSHCVLNVVRTAKLLFLGPDVAAVHVKTTS
jgi:hypothetical protein